jgi:MraZ protein
MSPKTAAKKGKKNNPFPNSFIGEYNFTVDSRGRTNFPAPFRHALSRESKERLVLAKGVEECVVVFPRDVWEKLQSENLPSLFSPQKHRIVRRHLYHGARESGFDAQGRITIPPRLLALAKIDKEVLIVGEGDRAMIWNPEIYDKLIQEEAPLVKDLIEEIHNPAAGKAGGTAGGT